MAASNGQTNIEKYLLKNGSTSKGISKPYSAFSPFSSIPKGLTDPLSKAIPTEFNSSTVVRILIYIVSIIIIIFVILLFVHFFIKPIFILHPGSSGIIPIPGFDNGVLFWDKDDPKTIPNKDLPIASLYFNYSLTIDMFIQNPLLFSKKCRVLFRRGGTLTDDITSDTINVNNLMTGAINDYNLAVALLPDTNDMIVSVFSENPEDVKIPNIPVQTPFKLGIVILEKAMEVYLNGYLVNTRIYSKPLKTVLSDFEPAKDTTIVKVRNLKIWPRVLTSPEIRYSIPSLSPAASFNPSAIPPSSCSGTPG